MQNQKQQTFTVQTDALQKYLTSLFPESILPPLPKFLQLKSYKMTESLGQTFTLNSGVDPSDELSNLLEAQSIIYLHSGVIELHKSNGKHWQRDTQYKEGFFTLLNYRHMSSLQPQRYRMVVKTKSTISIIPIRSPYGFDWLSKNWYKNILLGRTFYFNDSGMESQRKKQKFKQFISLFKAQTVRRDTRFLVEGRKNQKIYIVGRGEAKIMKDLRGKDQKGNTINGIMPIVYIREGSVLGGELFLIASKIIHAIISTHDKNRSIKQEDQEDGQEMMRPNKRKQSPSKSRLGKVEVQEGGYVLFSPHDNISNYSAIAQSANLQLYSISIDEFIQNVSQRLKINFTKLLQQTYVTMLRRTHQKLVLQLKKEEEKASQSNNTLNLMTSQIYSNNDMSNDQKQGITIKRSEIGAANQNMNKLRREEVCYHQQKNLERRADLMKTEHKPKTDFRHKIQVLLQEKLGKGKKEVRSQVAQEKIANDLAEIFRKTNQGRTENIEQHNELLNKKIALLAKRGGWQSGWDMIKEEGVTLPTHRKASIQSNYLTHSSPQHLTFLVKEEYACKIHQANKIKQQFMKIKSQCRSCSCYDNFQKFSPRRSLSTLTRSAYRTTEGWGRATTRLAGEEKPLEKVYNQMRFLSQKSKQKYNHNVHLLKVRRNKDKLERKKSAPALHYH